ncbi:MAG: diguanylate cyclase [Acidobacteriia bacterium]|nr:diguanylate cyclase [Terriglobia bacterium]
MNICIPVTEDQGAQSSVSAHFGSAPLYMIVDTDSGACRAVPNRNVHHGHGMCAPLAALAGESIDGMVVGGIGMGALAKLGAAGVRVFRSEHETVEKTVAAFRTGKLETMSPDMACARHGHGQP